MHKVIKISGTVDGKKVDLTVSLDDKEYISFFNAITKALKKAFKF